MAGLAPLEAILRMAKTPRALAEIVEHMDAKGATKVGQIFQDAATANPEYFVTGRELPGRMTDTQAAKFLSDKHDPAGGMALSPVGTIGNFEVSLPGGSVLKANSEGPLGSMYDEYAGSKILQKKGLLGRRGTRADIDAGTDVYDINTQDIDKGAGDAKHAYPLAWEYILSRPNAMNISRALSESNSFRRTANMAGFYEKYPELANRIMMNESQLTSELPRSGVYGKTAQFHEMSPEAQSGILNAVISQRTSAEAERLLGRLLNASRDTDRPGIRDNAVELLKAADRLGMEPGKPFAPTTAEGDPSLLRRQGDILYSAGRLTGSPSAVGADSVRRSALANDAQNGLLWQDIRDDPRFTNRLGRKAGGSVSGLPCSCHQEKPSRRA